VLPPAADGSLDLGGDLVLTHLRLEGGEPAPIELQPGQAKPGTAYPGEGLGPQAAARKDTLEHLIAELNERHGLNLDERHQLTLDQLERSLLADDGLREVARNNSLERFRLEFDPSFTKAVVENEERNREVYELIAANPALADRIRDFCARKIYAALRQQ
jgi:hypothetical protein